MSDTDITAIADRPSPHGIEIDGIGYVADPPKWIAEAMTEQQEWSGANVIKLRVWRSGERAT